MTQYFVTYSIGGQVDFGYRGFDINNKNKKANEVVASIVDMIKQLHGTNISSASIFIKSITKL